MTRFNNKYPYTDFHELNADWLLGTVKDAAAEAQEASDTVATYNDRLTTVEGDLAPIKAAMPGLASDVSGLKHDVGIMDSLITDTINPGLDTLKNEVETPSTGLLDRVTTLKGKVDEHDNDINNIEGRMTTYDQNFLNINNNFLSDQSRIRDLEAYRTEAQVEIGNLRYSIADPFDASAAYSAGDYVTSDKCRLYQALVDIPAGSANIDDLTQFKPITIASNMGSLTEEIPFDTSFTDANFRYVKNGNMVTLYAVFPVNSSISGHALMGHIPTEIQPPSYAAGMLINPNSGANVPFYIDGATFNMYNMGGLSSGAWILTATYYTAN